MRFVGLESTFGWLDAQFARVSASEGRFIALRGRRQVGKSRMLTEWLARRGHPSLYYQALGRPLDQELASFAKAVARSSLGRLPAAVEAGATWSTWQDALDALGQAGAGAPLGDGPAVVVLDEFPYLLERDPGLEGTLQAAWDHDLQHTGILLVIVGSDVSMMEALTTYGRPLYQRAVPRQLEPLDPAEVAELLGLDPTEALDTYLMTGGFPKIVAERGEHASREAFLAAATADEAHPLVFTGAQMLDAEFPPHLGARAVLEAIGSGARAFSAIRTRAGVSERTLAAALEQLAAAGVITRSDPRASRRITKRTRYGVADPYLRFWLRFLAERRTDVARGRGDLVAADIDYAWQDYAGSAIEPLVRSAIERLLPDPRFGEARLVGAYWTRDHSVEVDLVGTDRDGPDAQVAFTGAVKWRASRPFDADDAGLARRLGREVPGWQPTTSTVGVSRTGFTDDAALDVALGPDELLAAWR